MKWQDIFKSKKTTVSEIKAEITSLETEVLAAQKTYEALGQELMDVNRAYLAGDGGIKAAKVASVQREHAKASIRVETIEGIIIELKAILPGILKVDLEAEIATIDAALKTHQVSRAKMVDLMVHHFSIACLLFESTTGMIPQALDHRYLVGNGDLEAKYRDALSRNAKDVGASLADAVRTATWRRQDLKEKLLDM